MLISGVHDGVIGAHEALLDHGGPFLAREHPPDQLEVSTRGRRDVSARSMRRRCSSSRERLVKAQNASLTRSTDPSGAVIAMPIGEFSNALEKLASLRRSASWACSRSVTSKPTTRTSSTAPEAPGDGQVANQK